MRRLLGVASLAALCVAGPAAAQQAPPPKDVLAVARGLADDAPAARKAAAVALADRWPDGAKAVPALVEALDDEEAGVRAAAAGALEALGKAALPVLSAHLDVIGRKPSATQLAPEAAVLADLLEEMWQLGPAFTPRDFAGAYDRGSTPSERRSVLAALAVADFWTMSVLGTEFTTPLIEDPRVGDMAAAAVALAGWTAARDRGLASGRSSGEAPANVLAAVRSEGVAVAGLATRLVAVGGWTGPTTEKSIREALAAAAGPDNLGAGPIKDLAEALGAVSDPARLPEALRDPGLIADERLAERFGSGLCRWAAVEDVVPLLGRPWARRAAVDRIVRSPTTPPAAEQDLRAFVRDEYLCRLQAAFALFRLGKPDAALAGELDRRVDRELGAAPMNSDTFDLACSAWWVAGAPPDRLVRLRTLIQRSAHDLTSGVAWQLRAFGPPAEPLAALFRSAATKREADWQEIAGALHLAGREFSRPLAGGARAEPLATSGTDQPASRSMTDAANDALLAGERAECLRALTKLGPAATSVMNDVDALRKDPNLRIAVAAGRASRAIRAK
jgi:hypothetical protein